jgi:hypothetical protein
MSLTAQWVAVLIAVALVLPGSARAMTIEKFGRMNNDDESTYVAILIEAAVNKYKAAGQPDQGAKIMAYFKTPGRFGGVQQFAAKLESINGSNARYANNPNNRQPILLVEDAMSQTLKDAGYDVPTPYLVASGKDFRPVGPPRGAPAAKPSF